MMGQTATGRLALRAAVAIGLASLLGSCAPSEERESLGRRGQPLLLALESELMSPTFSGDMHQLGFSVAVSGDTAVVGAPSAQNPSGAPSGAAVVFVRMGTDWTEQQVLYGSEAVSQARFGSAVALEGDTVVIGAAAEANDPGAAYVFTRTGTSWTELQKLVASDATSNVDWFGASVDIDGMRLIVGEPRDDQEGSNAGAAYLFERIGTTWGERRKFTGSQTAFGTAFGMSVAVSGATVAVGAPMEGPTYTGAAYVFAQDGSIWAEQQRLQHSESTANDYTGYAVALDGDTLLVSGDGRSSTVIGSGAAYVYQRISSTWNEQATLLPTAPEVGDHFGWAVALQGDRAVISDREDPLLGETGSAYVYSRSGTSWSEEVHLEPSGRTDQDWAGYSVALDADTVLIGGPADNLAGAGRAWSFLLSAPLGLGEACLGGSLCASGFCVDGVCCDTGCSAGCVSCLAAQTGGADGTCSPVTAGTDPRDGCADQSATCDTDGTCDGAGACRLTLAGTPCGQTNCTAGVQTGNACDGNGNCAAANVDCGSFGCNGNACATSCSGDGDCAASAYCEAGKCVAKAAPGEPCSAGNGCTTAFCVDGICCDTACSGQCEACDISPNQGTCVPVNGDPRGTRSACAGTGQECGGTCNGVDRAACTFPGSTTPCGTPSCAGGVATRQVCDGAGQCVPVPDEPCGAYACGDTECSSRCTSDDHCAAGFRCNVSTSQCEPASGKCVDGNRSAEDSAGNAVSCEPYFCAGGACQDSCATTDDCIDGYACESDRGRCVRLSGVDEAPDDAGSCGCRTAGGRGASGVGLMLLFGLVLVTTGRALARGRSA